MTYELWQNLDGSLDFFPTTNSSARALLEEGAVLLTTINADNWEEASQKQYDYLGLGEYHPMPDPVPSFGAA